MKAEVGKPKSKWTSAPPGREEEYTDSEPEMESVLGSNKIGEQQEYSSIVGESQEEDFQVKME